MSETVRGFFISLLELQRVHSLLFELTKPSLGVCHVSTLQYSQYCHPCSVTLSLPFFFIWLIYYT